MLSTTIGWTMIIWTFILVGMMSIGGYFMFRKFMKVLPQSDGKSKLDWQNYYVEQGRHLWNEETRHFLDELVSPVPGPFRDIARHTIGAKISQLALEKKVDAVTKEICVEGYILATPKRDHRSLVKFLDERQIDYQPFVHLLDI
jgi:hypothetical protein